MADEAELRKFLKETDIASYLSDKEVKGLVSALKARIATVRTTPAPSTPSTASTSSPRPVPVVDESSLDLSNCVRIKMVVVGDGAVGKTSLLISYATDKFPEEYVPTVFENYSTQIPREDGSTILLHLWDTAGQEDYDRLRPLSYPGADIVLLCFSTVNRASFQAIKEKWYPEVNHYVRETPYILVGTKIDCRENKQVDPNLGRFDPVSTEMGQKMAEEIKAIKYLEVSAKTRHGLVNVFQESMNEVLSHREKKVTNTKKDKSNGCLLL